MSGGDCPEGSVRGGNVRSRRSSHGLCARAHRNSLEGTLARVKVSSYPSRGHRDIRSSTPLLTFCLDEGGYWPLADLAHVWSAHFRQ